MSDSSVASEDWREGVERGHSSPKCASNKAVAGTGGSVFVVIETSIRKLLRERLPRIYGCKGKTGYSTTARRKKATLGCLSPTASFFVHERDGQRDGERDGDISIHRPQSSLDETGTYLQERRGLFYSPVEPARQLRYHCTTTATAVGVYCCCSRSAQETK